MPSLKSTSATLTNEYVRLICAEVEAKEKGDISVRDINEINKIRAYVNMTDEVIRYQLRSAQKRMTEPDPDSDCS